MVMMLPKHGIPGGDDPTQSNISPSVPSDLSQYIIKAGRSDGGRVDRHRQNQPKSMSDQGNIFLTYENLAFSMPLIIVVGTYVSPKWASHTLLGGGTAVKTIPDSKLFG